jgi:hypothetical protein
MSGVDIHQYMCSYESHWVSKKQQVRKVDIGNLSVHCREDISFVQFLGFLPDERVIYVREEWLQTLDMI